MARSRIIVEFPDRPAYTVRIGGGLVAQLGVDLRAAGVDADRCVVLCDSDSSARCLPALRESLIAAGFRVSSVTIQAAEANQAWECAGELHRAIARMGLPAGTPIVVNACVQATELAAFAVATYGGGCPLVVVPASLACAFRAVGVDSFELDAGHPVPVVAPARLAFAVVDTALLACESAQEAEFGLDELSLAAEYCDADYLAWHDQNQAAIADYDEEACVLALTQTLAARADAIGRELSAGM